MYLPNLGPFQAAAHADLSSMWKSRFLWSGPHWWPSVHFQAFWDGPGPGPQWRCGPAAGSWKLLSNLVPLQLLSTVLTSLVEQLWFLLHIFVLLIFLLCPISEVSDYVSIKHVFCPAINVLIAAEKENPLGAVDGGLLFIRAHSSEVGQPAILRCPFTLMTTYSERLAEDQRPLICQTIQAEAKRHHAKTCGAEGTSHPLRLFSLRQPV